MAAPSTGTPATRLAGLERFSQEVFSNSQGKYALQDYDYYDDTSLFSAAAFTVAAGGLAAGVQIALFNVAQGAANNGAGFPAAAPLFNGGLMSLAETNLQRGQAGGKFPQNQSYVAIAGGFYVYCVPMNAQGTAFQQVGGIPIPDASDAAQIVNSFTWQWNIGGTQSPTILYEPLVAWPAGFGVWGIGAAGTTQAVGNGGPVSSMRKFSFPLMFPPNTAAEMLIACRRAVTNLVSLNNGSLVIIAAHLRGYMLSKVR